MKHLFFTLLVLGCLVTGLQGQETSKNNPLLAAIEAGEQSRAKRESDAAAREQARLLEQIAANQRKQIEASKAAAEQQDYRSRETITRLDGILVKPVK
jgi:hypothetical protein